MVQETPEPAKKEGDVEDLQPTASKIGDIEDAPAYDAVFGEITEEGPNYRNVWRYKWGYSIRNSKANKQFLRSVS